MNKRGVNMEELKESEQEEEEGGRQAKKRGIKKKRIKTEGRREGAGKKSKI